MLNPLAQLDLAAIYVRVSTAIKVRNGSESAFEQNPEVQELPLRELVEQRGWIVQKVYSDRASGTAVDRNGLKALLADARRGKFDVVLVWRFDRFARSVEQLALAKTGMSLREIARKLGVGATTVRRVWNAR